MNIVEFMKEFNYFTDSAVKDGNMLFNLEKGCIDLFAKDPKNIEMFRTNLIEPSMLHPEYSGPSITGYFDQTLVNSQQFNDDTNIRRF